MGVSAFHRTVLASAAVLALGIGSGSSNAAGPTDSLPPELKALYDGAPQTVTKSAYDDFKLPPKPWKWCHSESYQGNPWRVSVTNELKRLVEGANDGCPIQANRQHGIGPW